MFQAKVVQVDIVEQHQSNSKTMHISDSHRLHNTIQN